MRERTSPMIGNWNKNPGGVNPKLKKFARQSIDELTTTKGRIPKNSIAA